MREYYFEDLQVGYRYSSPYGRTITEADNIWFTLLTNNVNPIHFDKKYVEENYSGPPFHGRLAVNGLLTLSIAVGLTTELSAKGFMLGISNVKFIKPVFHGDTIRVECEVIEARESKSLECYGIVKLRGYAYNQYSEIVLEFERTIAVPKRECKKRDT
ncbi:MAG: MaoC family dehydratase [Acidilobaceae archaeon]